MKTFKLKAFKLSGIALSIGTFLSSCSANMEEKTGNYEKMKMADSVSAIIQKKTPDIFLYDTVRVFIRKADLQFKVKDVQQSTYQIEEIVRNHGGFVTLTNLESHIQSKSSVRTNKDSVTDITNYQVENNMTIRVPNEELDIVLTDISILIDFIDHRKITADDIKFKIMANRLSEARFQNHKKRIEKAIEEHGKKPGTLTDVENQLVNKQQAADETKIETLELIDEVDYSTVTLNVYQPETQKTEHYAYIEPMKPYEPGFGSRLWDSITDGAKFLEVLLFFMIRLWPVVLMGSLVFIIIKWILKRQQTHHRSI